MKVRLLATEKMFEAFQSAACLSLKQIALGHFFLGHPVFSRTLYFMEVCNLAVNAIYRFHDLEL